MEDRYLLSICIPTYNRADYLKKCLDNVVCQFNDEIVKNSVEVVISDNASSDNTKELAENYQSRFNNINYFRNKENVGMDENVIASVLKSRGKYCWHIGDDDLIQNGALKFIVNLLRKKDVSLMTVNFLPFIDINKSLEKDKNIDEGENFASYHNSAEEFWSKGYCQGILGLSIFNKSAWSSIDRKNYERLWADYEIILKMMASSDLPLAYINHPLIFIGQDYRWNEGGTALFTSINIKKILDKLVDYGYSQKFIDSKKLMMADALPKNILSAKGYGLKCSFSNLRLIYKEFYNYPISVFAATLIFFIPNPIIKMLKSVKNTFRK